MTGTPNGAPPAGYMEALSAIGMHPGWAKREPAMWPAPRTTYVPAVWRYADALKALTQAAAFVSPEFAERRNLILANPVPGNTYPTCSTMVAAYQLVLPTETARSHRHTPNALRLVLDAEAGIYTLVNGVRVDMAPGDIVLTPQWHWHGHANYSTAPAFWIDILDVPLVQKLENMFFQHHSDTLEAVAGTDPDSPLRFRGAETIIGSR
jgi:gentisate 1,2-dioxygenase